MRLNEGFFTLRPFSYFNSHSHTFGGLLAQHVLGVALKIFVALGATHFLLYSLKLQVSVVACFSCSLILSHIIADYFFKKMKRSPEKISDDEIVRGNKGEEREETRDFMNNLGVSGPFETPSPFIKGSIPPTGEPPPNEEEFNLLPRCLLNEFDQLVDNQTYE